MKEAVTFRPAIGGGGDGPGAGGEPGGVVVAGAVGILPGHDGAADRALGGVVVKADHRVAAVRGQAVQFPVQGGEHCFRLLQAGGGHLLLPGLVDNGECLVPGGAGLPPAGRPPPALPAARGRPRSPRLP